MLDFKDNGAYTDIDADESNLDGHFTANELREIADLMDEMKSKEK